MDNKTIANTIKQAVDVKDLAARYGYTANRAGFICCPIHNEKTPSLKLERNRWHCFGCHAGGDAIEFVRKVDGIGFSDACRKLDAMYGLGLYGEVHPVIATALKRRAATAASERDATQKRVERLEEAYWTAFDRWLSLDAILCATSPLTPADITPEYAHACREIRIAAEAVREAEWALFDALGITPNAEYYSTYPLQGDPKDCFACRKTVS